MPTSVQRGNVLDDVAPISGLTLPLLEGGGRIGGPIPKKGTPTEIWRMYRSGGGRFGGGAPRKEDRGRGGGLRRADEISPE